MDSSTYYDGREDGNSPALSPLTPNFDRYMPRGVDDSPYFGDAAGTYAPIQGDGYSMGSRGSAEQRDSGFSLDFLPTGDTMPRPYPGTIDQTATSPNPPWEIDSSRALYADRDSSEEVRLQQYGQSFDGYHFLPSPPEADGAYDASVPRKKSDKKKRKHQPSSTKDKAEDEKPSRPMTQLRTASRAPKRYGQSTGRKPAESFEEVKARAAHNQVEQQYRKRLNQQFERLLAVLPQPDYDEEGDDGDGEGGSRGSMDKRISKAEVLDLARRRIKLLEKERASLEKQKRELALSVVRLQDEWTRRLGGTLPVKTEGKRD